MLIITGTVNKTRSVNFKTGPALFLELFVDHPDRPSQVFEIKLADGMSPDKFAKGATVSLAISVGAKDSRLYYSALRTQPDGYPKITTA